MLDRYDTLTALQKDAVKVFYKAGLPLYDHLVWNSQPRTYNYNIPKTVNICEPNKK